MTPRSSPMTREASFQSPKKRIATRRLQSSASQSSLISEVRQSLSMPGSSNFQDEEDEEEYIKTATEALKNPPIDQRPFASQRSSFDDSDNLSIGSISNASAFSTISTRKKKKRFLSKLRRRKHADDDGASVSSFGSRFSWWGGSQGSTKTKRRKFRLWKRRKRKGNDQLVAEFFDGQGGADNDSASVASGLTLSSSNGLVGMFLRRRKNRDDVLEREKSNFFGHGVVDQSSVDRGIDDEEITLGSGFENMSFAGSADDMSVGSRSSIASSSQQMRIPQRRRQKRPKTFLDRMLKRRKRKKKNTAIRLALKGDERSESEGTLEDLELPREKMARKERSVRSLGDTPSSGKIVSRWDSNDSIASDASAPKQPKRRIEEVAKSKASQSMRNLTSCNDEFGQEDDESDDDSVLSLLSGLLLAWSEEQIETHGKLPFRNPMNDIEAQGILKPTGRASSGLKNNVAFAAIEIREYERILGDNPSCSRGPPISIGWSYVLAFQGGVEEYETSVRTHKRSKKEFYCTAEKRTQVLLNEWGVTEDEMNRARRECTYIQYCRAKTSFSTSRAAAKEAAFLRKANDRGKLLDVKLESAPTDGNVPIAKVDLPAALQNGLTASSGKSASSSSSPPRGQRQAIVSVSPSTSSRPTFEASSAPGPQNQQLPPSTVQNEDKAQVAPVPEDQSSTSSLPTVQSDQRESPPPVKTEIVVELKETPAPESAPVPVTETKVVDRVVVPTQDEEPAATSPFTEDTVGDASQPIDDSESVPAAEESSVSTSQSETTSSAKSPLASEFLEI